MSYENQSDNVDTDETSNCSSKNLPKSKNYRIKNKEWHCQICSIYCNSVLQFEMHLISQKHKQIDLEQKANLEAGKLSTSKEEITFNDRIKVDSSLEANETKDVICLDENNNVEKTPSPISEKLKSVEKPVSHHRTTQFKTSYSPIEISQNLIAIKFNVNAEKYLIPENKKNGKFEKFGFYCSLCNAYMTGQIQLIMHVKGAKHQYYSPNEIPGYKSTKLFNPTPFLKSYKKSVNSSNGSKSLPNDENNNIDSRKKLNQSSTINKQSFNQKKFSITNFTSSPPVLSNGTYYDYLVRNEALMHSHHHHHRSIAFNSTPGLNHQMTSSSFHSGYDFFNHHHHQHQQQQHQHSNIYLTPAQRQTISTSAHFPQNSKFLRIPTTMTYNYTPPPYMSPNDNLQLQQQSHPNMYSNNNYVSPPELVHPPPPATSSSATGCTNHSTPVTTHSYQIISATNQNRNSLITSQSTSSMVNGSRLKVKINGNINTVFTNVQNTNKDLGNSTSSINSSNSSNISNKPNEDQYFYETHGQHQFQQQQQHQHQMAYPATNGISIITKQGMHQIHHLNPSHQNQCNIYFTNTPPPQQQQQLLSKINSQETSLANACPALTGIQTEMSNNQSYQSDSQNYFHANNLKSNEYEVDNSYSRAIY